MCFVFFYLTHHTNHLAILPTANVRHYIPLILTCISLIFFFINLSHFLLFLKSLIFFLCVLHRILFFTVIPQTCKYKGRRFECGLSISCVLAGGKPVDSCSGGMIWSCCVDKDLHQESTSLGLVQNASEYPHQFSFNSFDFQNIFSICSHFESSGR